MGHSTNHALIISISGYAWNGDGLAVDRGVTPESFEAWRSKLDPKWQALIVGPVPHIINGGYTIAMLPHGSKDGWGDAIEGNHIRNELVEMFSFDYGDPSDSPFSVVEVLWNLDPHGDPEAYDPREVDGDRLPG